MGPNGCASRFAEISWLPGKVSNLDSSRSERDVLPITPPGTKDVGSLVRASLLSVSCAERRRLTMAIRAEHPKVLEAMIVPYAVAMMELNGQLESPPLAHAAIVALLTRMPASMSRLLMETLDFDSASIRFNGNRLGRADKAPRFTALVHEPAANRNFALHSRNVWPAS